VALRVLGRLARIEDYDIGLPRLLQQLAGFDQEIHLLNDA